METKQTHKTRGNQMTIEQTKKFYLGKDYWNQYVFLNGYSWEPTNSGLKKLSKNLDVNMPHLRECINTYLEA